MDAVLVESRVHEQIRTLDFDPAQDSARVLHLIQECASDLFASAFIQQRELQSVADLIALSGAQGIDLEEYYRTGATQSTRLNSAQVQNIARTHAKVMTEGSEVALTALTVVPDGKSVLVTLTTPLRLTFFDPLSFDPVQVSASARVDYAP